MAEGEELNHVRKQIEKFVKIGLSPEASKEVVQTERGKVSETIERKIYKGLEGTGAMGAIADKFLSNKGK